MIEFRSTQKNLARGESVIKPIKEFFNGKVPNQYWTLGGLSSDENGDTTGSEFHHVTSEGLIEPCQFHSVEFDKAIYEQNSKIPLGSWYNGDFFDVIKSVDNRKLFNPSVINYDSMLMQKGAADYLAQMLAYFTVRKFCNMMVISNSVLRNPYNGECQFTNENDYINYLRANPKFLYAMRNGWKLNELAYVYNGRDGRSSEMMTTIFTN